MGWIVNHTSTFSTYYTIKRPGGPTVIYMISLIMISLIIYQQNTICQVCRGLYILYNVVSCMDIHSLYSNLNKKNKIGR